MAPAGGDSSDRNAEITFQLRRWAKRDGTGRTFDSSGGDSLPALQDKMREYMDHGARLGWLIDPSGCQVFVYRPDSPPERLKSPPTVSAGPLLPGFRLEMDEIL